MISEYHFQRGSRVSRHAAWAALFNHASPLYRIQLFGDFDEEDDEAVAEPDAPMEQDEPIGLVEDSVRADEDDGRRLPGGRATWIVDGGEIKFPGDSIITICANSLHRDGKNPCRLSRTSKSKDAASSRGRPLGFLLAWLKLGSLNRDLHCKAVRKKTMTDEDKCYLCCHDRRSALRLEFSANNADANILLGTERRKKPGEADEPADISS